MERPTTRAASAGTEAGASGPTLVICRPHEKPGPGQLTVYRPGIYDVYTESEWAACPPGAAGGAHVSRLRNGCRAVYRGPLPRN